MEVYKFEDIQDEIAQNIRDRRLIPILGSGFSQGCTSRHGVVPSGEDMKGYMVQEIVRKSNTTKKLETEKFSSIARYYNKCVSKEKRLAYIRDNFTDVSLPQNKIDFLEEIDWLYIYTLNMDNAIEQNSKYKQVILPNRDVNFESLENYKCIIKLHGDANSYVLYRDDDSQIFSFKQYAQSIFKNESLLKKLQDDFTYNNLVFIGCSLDSEYDLATIDTYQKKHDVPKTSKYYCVLEEPDNLTKMELEDYGITHIVLFDDYDSIYSNFLLAYAASKEVKAETLDKNRNIPVKHGNKENTFSYLVHGKNPYDIKAGIINLPIYFIYRNLRTSILDALDFKPVHIVYGSRVSGKTYLLFSIIDNVKDRDVYYFDSSERVSKEVYTALLKKKKSLFIFDTSSIDKNFIFEFIDKPKQLVANNNKVIIAVNTSDKDIVSTINNTEKHPDIKGYKLEAKFSKEEVLRINPLISQESVLYFERDIENISKSKFVLNAKYWLLNYLGSIAKDKGKQVLIVDAYKRIIQTIQKLCHGDKRKLYSKSMDYIRFDVINEIFFSKDRGQLGLAKLIYEGLHQLLSDNPHFYHQRAKCYLWQSGYQKEDIHELEKALNYAKIAQHNFKIEYNRSNNEKIATSLAHTNFTIALITARLCDINGNTDVQLWDNAISAIYDAINSPYNNDDFASELKHDRKRNSLKYVIIHSQTCKLASDYQQKAEFIYNKLLKA